VLHANGLIVAGAHVALCGSSRMGKSTLAYAWRQRGGQVYADDAVPFRVEAGAVFAHSLPFRIRPRRGARDFFGPSPPASSSSIKNPQPATGVSPGPLRTIYLLDRRTDDTGPVELRAVRPDEALPVLLGQSFYLHLRDPNRNRDMIANYAALVTAVPVYQLSYPTGLNHVGATLDRIALHEAGQAAEQSVAPSCRE
jgi:hypothetical protein